ncbi:hypothetical protein PVAP13_8NG254900 [Panicum virgatum]|uniref:Uncharacterized protein n=1 Tax=Panicum virgatum TaxID=38727 RepID=A0A8T0P5G4_PANVG|nr:hypothetical protein PVAP13_8NG254900 [Panicum virgatum]
MLRCTVATARPRRTVAGATSPCRTTAGLNALRRCRCDLASPRHASASLTAQRRQLASRHSATTPHAPALARPPARGATCSFASLTGPYSCAPPHWPPPVLLLHAVAVGWGRGGCGRIAADAGGAGVGALPGSLAQRCASPVGQGGSSAATPVCGALPAPRGSLPPPGAPTLPLQLPLQGVHRIWWSSRPRTRREQCGRSRAGKRRERAKFCMIKRKEPQARVVAPPLLVRAAAAGSLQFELRSQARRGTRPQARPFPLDLPRRMQSQGGGLL